jgi:hypothetical protein
LQINAGAGTNNTGTQQSTLVLFEELVEVMLIDLRRFKTSVCPPTF